MKWTRKESRFNYNGKPVVRHSAISQTPLGEFKVFEAIGGKTFIIHPFIKRTPLPFADALGIAGFEPDPFGELTAPPRIQVKTFEEGIARCEAKWRQIKITINECE